MARRRQRQAPAEELLGPVVPGWVTVYESKRWQPRVKRRTPPGDLAELIDPQRWLGMEGRRLWHAARDAWLDEHDVPRADRLRPPYAVEQPKAVHSVNAGDRLRGAGQGRVRLNQSRVGPNL